MILGLTPPSSQEPLWFPLVRASVRHSERCSLSAPLVGSQLGMQEVSQIPTGPPHFPRGAAFKTPERIPSGKSVPNRTTWGQPDKR